MFAYSPLQLSAHLADQTAHILICTPGRLHHFVSTDRIVDLSLCRILVLEECDKLLEADFSSVLRETREVCEVGAADMGTRAEWSNGECVG